MTDVPLGFTRETPMVRHLSASIHCYPDEIAARKIARLAREGGRSALLRALIVHDVRRCLALPEGLLDQDLTHFRTRTGRWRRGDAPLRVRMTDDLRHLARRRARILGFSVTEYLLALAAQEYERRGYARHDRTVVTAARPGPAAPRRAIGPG
jgi:hypothetical protein